MRKDLSDVCRQRNSDTATLGDAFKSHRDKVMTLIRATVADIADPESSGEKLSSIVLLGAGNCLDVDLTELGDSFKTLHFVDLDESAVNRAISEAGVVDQSQVHAPTDIAEPLLSLTSRDFEPTEENREYCINVLQNLSSENGVADVPEADVVVSLCVFSQIIDSLSRLIPEGHATFTNALKAIRIGHLRRLLSLLRPGGVAIFVTDIASSESVPELDEITDDELQKLIPRLVEERRFYSGTNPSMVLGDLNVLSRLPTGPDTVHTIDPWIWNLGERRLAVYALRIQKRPPVAEESPQQEKVDAN